MKHITIRILVLLSLLLLLAGCKEETYKFGEPFSKLAGINGSFVLTQVVQVDERSTSLENTMDISDFFIGSTPAVISFKSSDFSYSLQPGTMPNFFGENAGSWKFDDNDFPTEIQLSSSGNSLTLFLSRTIREIDNTLEFRFTRFCSGKEGVSYNYVFTRQ